MKLTGKSYKTPGTKLSKAQKQVKSKLKNEVTLKNKLKNQLFDTKSEGVGKYANKKDISRRAYKLEKRALRNEALGLNTKPQMIKAAGEAFAMNLSPSLTSYASTAGTGKLIESINKGSNMNSKVQEGFDNIAGLIKGGVNQAGMNNEEEEDEGIGSLPGGFNPR